ncbi:MAG: hypothetical protein ACOYL6_09630 [Bacteriovoracaceae bacterium]
MQSYLSMWETGFLTLEIGYFLLCIVSQFKRLSAAVLLSTLINLGILYLLQQSFQQAEIFPQKLHLAAFGIILFSLLSLSIFSVDGVDNKSKKNVATKLPIIGLGIGFYIPDPYCWAAFILCALVLAQFLMHHRHRYRLYLRTYLFTLLFTALFILSFLIPWFKYLSVIFLFFVIMYLNQLLNLMIVKAYLGKDLGRA